MSHKEKGNEGEGGQNRDAGGDAGQRFENAATGVSRGPSFAAAESPVSDLSAEIVRVLPREEGQVIKCRRINGDRYRCNWWGVLGTRGYDNPGMQGLLVTTHRVIKSQLVRARKDAGGLVIEPYTRQ
jgi:hypothetical protein